jgi:hypothetical protein
MVHQHNLGLMALKQEKMILSPLGITNLKQHQRSKPPHLLELRYAYYTTVIQPW